MTRPGLRAAHAARSAAIALVGVAGVLAPHLAKAADSKTAPTAAECRAMTDFTARGQCWDDLDRAGLQDQKVVKKREFGLGAKAPSVAAIKETRARKPDAVEVHGLTLTLASVVDTAVGHILMISTDGAVWEQTDGDAIQSRPAPGDTVEISKGMLGGYMCQVTRWQSVRCQRDQ
jgi:hypothetical protein